MGKLTKRFKSDSAAVGSIEIIMLIFLAVVLVIVINNTVIKAISQKAELWRQMQ